MFSLKKRHQFKITLKAEKRCFHQKIIHLVTFPVFVWQKKGTVFAWQQLRNVGEKTKSKSMQSKQQSRPAQAVWCDAANEAVRKVPSNQARVVIHKVYVA